MTENNNNAPHRPQNPQNSSNPNTRNATLRTVQTLITISFIAGPTSLLIGGVPLSAVTLACAIIALKKVQGVISANEPYDSIAQNMKKQAKAGIAISAFALVLNSISLAITLPAMIEMLQTDDYTQLLGNAANGAGAASSASSSVWG